MTPAEFARKLGKSERAVLEWCEKGYIRGVQEDEATREYILPSSAKEPYTKARAKKGASIYTSIVKGVMRDLDVSAALYGMDENLFDGYIRDLLDAGIIGKYTAKDTGITYYRQTLKSDEFSKLPKNKVVNFLKQWKPDILLNMSL